ncbi:TPA: V-type ATP synthase subunit D [Candidatus Woesearchaeota archaeon]|nr:V-type ATP synthase subunit D [Candidatus Woesearchaeota archaeon]HII68717.1 V-type ATP synthase subunit D [Candidatus Woesearchaeota archaeon]
MAQDIKPTRSELMKLKKKIKLAKSGYNLLKKKRDGLILDFFVILKKVKTLRTELTEEYKRAQKKIALARILESDLHIRSVALAISQTPTLELKKKNIMGVVVPSITSSEVKKKFAERGFGYYDSIAIDEAADAFEGVVEKVLIAAEVETSMRKILKEIEKTKRRVNALEFAVIPQMEKTQSFIKMRLEEMDRENTFRLKRIKQKLENAQAA